MNKIRKFLKEFTKLRLTSEAIIDAAKGITQISKKDNSIADRIKGIGNVITAVSKVSEVVSFKTTSIPFEYAIFIKNFPYTRDGEWLKVEKPTYSFAYEPRGLLYSSFSGCFEDFQKDVQELITNKSFSIDFKTMVIKELVDLPTVNTELSNSICEEIKLYEKNNYNYSAVFYGRPGTGKSTLARTIAKHFGNYIVIEELSSLLDTNSIVDTLKILNSKIIVIEDFDRNLFDKKTLSLLEEFKQLGIHIIATINKLENIDSAILRPGRFDKIVEINKLEESVVLEMVDNDIEIFNIVKDYPIAYINEFIKRIKLFGKEKALSSFDDIKIRGRAIEEEYLQV